MEFEELQTKRLILRKFTPETYKEVYATYTDAELLEMLGVADLAALEVEREKSNRGINTYRTSIAQFRFRRKDTGKVIGVCGFHNWFAMHNRAEVGYIMLAEQEKQQGYMKEALKAVLTYGFEHMTLNRVEAYISPWNIPSLKLVENYGFRPEGMLRQHFNYNNKLEDSLVFGLLKGEWAEEMAKW